MPLWAGMLAAFAAGVAQKADFVQSRLEKRPVATAHAVCSGVIACHVCNWSAAEGRFCAIAAGKMPLLAGMLATFAAGVPQKADFVQSRLGRCSFGPECLPRLQLECCRRPISCNRGRENASYGRNACRVCSWSAAEGRFHAIAARKHPAATAHAVCSGVTACRVCSWSAVEGRFRAIAAGKTPFPAGMLATFAAGVAQKAVFMQSRPEKRPLRSECLPRLQLECPRRQISCNRGKRNASFRPAKRLLSAHITPPFGQRNAPSACKNYPRG